MQFHLRPRGTAEIAKSSFHSSLKLCLDSRKNWGSCPFLCEKFLPALKTLNQIGILTTKEIGHILCPFCKLLAPSMSRLSVAWRQKENKCVPWDQSREGQKNIATIYRPITWLWMTSKTNHSNQKKSHLRLLLLWLCFHCVYTKLWVRWPITHIYFHTNYFIQHPLLTSFSHLTKRRRLLRPWSRAGLNTI